MRVQLLGAVRGARARRRAATTALLLLLALVAAACDDDPQPAADTATGADVALPAATPAPDPNDPAPSFPYVDAGWAFNEPGDVVVIPRGESSATWAPFDLGRGDPLSPPFVWGRLYHPASDRFWRLTGPEGHPYSVTPLGGDQLIGVTEAALTGPQPAVRETVLLDLASGEVTQLLPFPVAVRWDGLGGFAAGAEPPGILDIEVRDIERLADDRRVRVGEYRYDLGSGALTYLGPDWYKLEHRYEFAEPLPDASYHPGATALVRRPIAPDAERLLGQGLFSLSLVDEAAGTERLMVEAASRAALSPDGRWLAVVDRLRGLRLVELRGIGGEHSLTMDGYWAPVWSPDGRFLFAQHSLLGREIVAIWDTTRIDESSGARLGPLTDVAFADWHPDGTEVLVFNAACEPGGYTLERLDPVTGERTPLPFDIPAVWLARWSPDGSRIALSAAHVPIGLFDPVSGARLRAPALDALEQVQGGEWTADGEWLLLHDLHAERCLG